MAHDVLAHHDGVVDQQAHAQAQRHQRDHVDGEAEQVHEQEGADQRDRQRQPGDDGRAPRVQEQEHDQHREQRAFDQRLAHVVHRHADRARAVKDGNQAHAGRQLRLQFGHRLAFRPSTTRWCSRPAPSAPTAARCAGRCRAPGSRSPARRRHRATWSRRIGAPLPLRATMMRPKSSGRCMRASICTTRSCASERIAPTGRSWFSLRTALATWSGVTPCASSACGLR
jgi:hypothetical protein